MSHFCFLILLAAATFRLDDRSHVITSTPRLFNNTYHDDDQDITRLNEDVDNALKDTFRPANILFTHVQICLMFWVFGTYDDKLQPVCFLSAARHFHLLTNTHLVGHCNSSTLFIDEHCWVLLSQSYHF